MRAFKTAFSILCGLVLLAALAPPAQASAVPRIPITCGMTVRQDAVLYLTEDLGCTETFAVHVEREPSEPGPVPHVLVDLRGHTLFGDGNNLGIHATTPGEFATYLTVINGRMENWGAAVVGDYDVRTKNVTFVGNRVGFGCYGRCRADRTHFKGNVTGFEEGEALGGVITRSSFVGNEVGARVRFIWSLSIDRSYFRNNDVGVVADDAEVTVSRSLFVKNRTGIQVITHGNDGPCARLSRVVFVRNGVRLDGPRCAS